MRSFVCVILFLCFVCCLGENNLDQPLSPLRYRPFLHALHRLNRQLLLGVVSNSWRGTRANARVVSQSYPWGASQILYVYGPFLGDVRAVHKVPLGYHTILWHAYGHGCRHCALRTRDMCLGCQAILWHGYGLRSR